MSYNIPKQLVVYKGNNLVDMLVTGNTILFTAAYDFFLYDFTYTLVDVQGGTPSGAFGSLGYNSPTFDNMSPALGFTFMSVGEAATYTTSINNPIIPSGLDLVVNINIADTGGPTTLLYSFNIIGYFV